MVSKIAIIKVITIKMSKKMDKQNLINSLYDLSDFAVELRQKCQEEQNIDKVDQKIFTELNEYNKDFVFAISYLIQNEISYEELKKASESINEESIAEFKRVLNNKIDNAIQPQPNKINITEKQNKITSGILEIAKYFARKIGLGQKDKSASTDSESSSAYTPKKPGKRM